MTTLTESAIFEEGIFQLEKSTPVLGGAPVFSGNTPIQGHSNAQAQQLANRTQWLRDQINSKSPAVSNYESLRAYTGSVTEIRVLANGVRGTFYRDIADTTSADNSGTVIVDSSNRRWKRDFLLSAGISILWFQPPTSDSGDALVAFNRAAAAAVAAQNGPNSASTPFVVVEGGTYFLSAATTGSVNWKLDPTGKLTTPSTVPGLDFSCERLTGSHQRSTGSNQFPSLIVGDAGLSPMRALTSIGAPNLFPGEVMGVSGKAAGGVTGASNTAARNGYDQGSIGVTALSVNDNTTTPKPGYALYTEGLRFANTGNQNAAEFTIVNYGTVVVDTPNKARSATEGETYNLVLTAGGGSGSGATDVTGAILISQKSVGKYEKGIVFKNGSISSNTAVAMWENQRITWFGVGDLNVEKEGVRLSGIVNTADQGQMNLNVWDNPSATWRGVSILPNALYPTNDNVLSIGTSALRTSVVYSATGTIQTSDKRYKKKIGKIPDNVLDVIESLEIVQFQFNDGNSGRLHAGVIAQDVEKAFKKKGLDAFTYGLLCYDEWEEQPEVVEMVKRTSTDSDGNTIEIEERVVTHPKMEAGNRYSVRYDELHAMKTAVLERTLNRLNARIKALEDR